jgi:threonine/homoserine/homoserine lactone efflux protein
MDMDTLLPLASFAFVTSITPGPNNLMLAASGVGFGLRRTLPLLLGVCVGFALLLVMCGFGIGAVVVQWPAAMPLLKAAGTAYLVLLAWKLRASLTTAGRSNDQGPVSFIAGAAFQFVNPKAWLMGITAAAVFLPGLGSSIRATLQDPRWQQRLGALVAGLTLYAAIAIWI